MMRIGLVKWMVVGAMVIALCGCREGNEVARRTSGFDEFIPRYNDYIKKWLNEQREATLKSLTETEQEISKAAPEQQEALKRKFEQLKREEAKWDYRLARGDYFARRDT
jgi:microcin C transport system substrate-binding protein